jgi:endonuclease/exonuclease/phosphatase family metal-dependent hydrolase
MRLLTYNVHGCLGTDGVLSPERIAEVIAHYEPDIVGLQELDVSRQRSGGIDQAFAIAEALRMNAHFHPAMHVMGEQYGDAILTALPSRLVKGGALPGLGWYRGLEPRGALWAMIETPTSPLQVINTHFGLLPQERRAQAEALLGATWLGGCVAPAILMGDFNMLPGAWPYRAFTRQLRDGHSLLGRRAQATFPARRPLVRIDHIFISTGIDVHDAEIRHHAAARVASDHLPLVLDIKITSF